MTQGSLPHSYNTRGLSSLHVLKYFSTYCFFKHILELSIGVKQSPTLYLHVNILNGSSEWCTIGAKTNGCCFKYEEIY